MAIDKINPFKFNNISTGVKPGVKPANFSAGGSSGGSAGSGSVAGVGGIKGTQSVSGIGKAAQGSPSYLNNNLFNSNHGVGLAPYDNITNQVNGLYKGKLNVCNQIGIA